MNREEFLLDRDFMLRLTSGLGFPDEAVRSLSEASELFADVRYAERLGTVVAAIKASEQDLEPILASLAPVAEASGTDVRQLNMLAFLLSARTLRAKYEKSGLSERIFLDSMTDARCKLLECREVRGVWGNDTGSWPDGFFAMTRFGLGRLQFEYTQLRVAFNGCGTALKEGDIAVNMHIPSSGRLNHEECMDSYRQAYASPLFQKAKYGGVMAFVCSSWLLFPEHEKFLQQDSNILTFARDFTLLHSDYSDVPSASWRIFGRYYREPFDRLPRDTGLRRAYAEWLCAGGQTGRGYGIILFDGEKVVNK